MSTEVVLHLPDNLYRQASRIAELSNRDLPRVLTETLENALFPLGPFGEALTPVEKLSDQEVLKLAESQMENTQGKRFSKLLACQNAGKLSESERYELAALLQVYQEGVLRKAQALAEAVRRGLREPLTPGVGIRPKIKITCSIQQSSNSKSDTAASLCNQSATIHTH